MRMSRLRTVGLDALQIWDRNYRVGNVDVIARSISRFGFNAVVRVRGGVVYAGNHSVLALRSLRDSGAEPPEGIGVAKGSWQVPCVEIDHLSEAEAMAFAVADNRASDLAENNDALLAELLGDLEPALLSDAGFTSAEIDKMISDMTPAEPIDAQAEWVGMPEFDQPNKEAYKSIVVHLRDAAALEDFEKLLGRKITNRYLWLPELEIERASVVAYVPEEDA